MRYQHELKLDVSVRARAQEKVRNERLIGVVEEACLHLGSVDYLERRLMKIGHDATRSAIEGAVPDKAARPVEKLRLADGDGVRTMYCPIMKGM